MSLREKPAAGADFDRRLQKLRLRFDLLPSEQRPHLCGLADAIEQQQRRSDNTELQNQPVADVDFEQRLIQMRLKIGLLPLEQRPQLYELADVVEQQQRQLHDEELQKTPLASAGFEQRLKQLRLRIDLGPSEQKPHLHKLADAVEQRYRRCHNGELQNNDVE